MTGQFLAKGADSDFTTIGTGGMGLRDVNTADPEAPYFAAYSGLNLNPSHGLLDMKFTATTLDARFVATDGAFTDAFSVASSGSNVPPTASFSSSCSNLTCAFDASASTDPDGTIASYAWDFGDGTSGTGPSPSHPYATPSSYNVTLAVTDNGGHAARQPDSHNNSWHSTVCPDAFDRTTLMVSAPRKRVAPRFVTGSTSDTPCQRDRRLRIASAASPTTPIWVLSVPRPPTSTSSCTDRPTSGPA